MGYVAGGLAALAFLWHAILGERFIVSKLTADRLPASRAADPDLVRLFLRVVWHMVSVDFAVSAAVLFFAGSRLAARIVAVHFAGYALVGILVAVAHRRFDAFGKIPQVYLLAAIAVLAWMS